MGTKLHVLCMYMYVDRYSRVSMVAHTFSSDNGFIYVSAIFRVHVQTFVT